MMNLHKNKIKDDDWAFLFDKMIIQEINNSQLLNENIKELFIIYINQKSLLDDNMKKKIIEYVNNNELQEELQELFTIIAENNTDYNIFFVKLQDNIHKKIKNNKNPQHNWVVTSNETKPGLSDANIERLNKRYTNKNTTGGKKKNKTLKKSKKQKKSRKNKKGSRRY